MLSQRQIRSRRRHLIRGTTNAEQKHVEARRATNHPSDGLRVVRNVATLCPTIRAITAIIAATINWQQSKVGATCGGVPVAVNAARASSPLFTDTLSAVRSDTRTHLFDQRHTTMILRT